MGVSQTNATPLPSDNYRNPTTTTASNMTKNKLNMNRTEADKEVEHLDGVDRRGTKGESMATLGKAADTRRALASAKMK